MKNTTEASIRRVTLLKLLPEIGMVEAENLLKGMSTLAKRIEEKGNKNSTVVMTETVDITVRCLDEFYLGDQRDRVSAKGVSLLLALYKDGFFTGTTMREPKVVERINNHLKNQQANAA